MSRMGMELPIPPRLCKETALRRNFLHRACRYAELEYIEAENESAIADLLQIHHDFQTREPDHALGLLQLTTSSTVEWAELGQWHATLQAYDAQLAKDPANNHAIKGVSRCLHALQEWDILLNFNDSKVGGAAVEVQQSVAPLIASAAWSAGRYDTMGQAISIMQGPEKSWYSGVLATIKDDLPLAQSRIDEARDLLCQDLGECHHQLGSFTTTDSGATVSIGGTRTGRGYDLLVRTQLLTELEEA